MPSDSESLQVFSGKHAANIPGPLFLLSHLKIPALHGSFVFKGLFYLRLKSNKFKHLKRRVLEKMIIYK